VFALSSQIYVTNGVTILGLTNGAGAVVSGGCQTRCFYLSHSNAVLDSLVIADGCAGNGGGVYIYESGSVINCTITNNTATNAYSSEETYGGGVYTRNGGTGLVERCLVSDNPPLGFAQQGGGVYLDGGMLRNCLVTRNRCYSSGAGVYCRGNAAILNCSVVSNLCDGRFGTGGGIAFAEGENAANCVVYGNELKRSYQRYVSNWHGQGGTPNFPTTAS